LATEQLMLKKSDLVVATSQLLYEKSIEKNDNSILVRNGTEFNLFYKLSPNGKLDHLRNKPIIGYYGAISEWFDISLVEYLARSKPDYNFVLIGSTWGGDITEVEKLPNVYFLGEKEYKTLPGYLFYFDVCLIPFKLIPLTMATNPVKFYEYISSGKPVVSVDLPELKQYENICYIAENYEQFLGCIEKALNEKEDKNLIEARIEVAKGNSWNERFKQILYRVENL